MIEILWFMKDLRAEIDMQMMSIIDNLPVQAFLANQYLECDGDLCHTTNFGGIVTRQTTMVYS